MEEDIQSVTRHYTNPGRRRNKRVVRVDSGTVSLFALTSDLTNSETVAATL